MLIKFIGTIALTLVISGAQKYLSTRKCKQEAVINLKQFNISVYQLVEKCPILETFMLMYGMRHPVLSQ